MPREAWVILRTLMQGYTVLVTIIAGITPLKITFFAGRAATYSFLLALCLVFFCTPGSFGQEKPQAPEAKSNAGTAAPRRSDTHPFWDSTNDLLFAGTGAARTLDYFSTLNMRRRGRQEILLTNDVVDNHAAFAAIEAAGTGVSIGAAYVFHRTGHHTLERWVSIVHISAATTGAVRNYCLKTAHPAATSAP